jgi:hypothetical protein
MENIRVLEETSCCFVRFATWWSIVAVRLSYRVDLSNKLESVTPPWDCFSAAACDATLSPEAGEFTLQLGGGW